MANLPNYVRAELRAGITLVFLERENDLFNQAWASLLQNVRTLNEDNQTMIIHRCPQRED